MSDPAPFLADDADAPALRQAISAIARAGYGEAAVRDRLGLADIAGLHWRNVSIYRDERLAGRDPLALAIGCCPLPAARFSSARGPSKSIERA
ncbi:MAG: hypothetical protein ACLQU1_25845 [Bryobacteraceae bacterium]